MFCSHIATVSDNSATTTATTATTTSTTDVITLNYFKTENESKLNSVIL